MSESNGKTTADRIFAIDDRPRHRIETPYWSEAGVEHVWYRVPSVHAADLLSASLKGGEDEERTRFVDYRAKVLQACLEDDDGKLIFSPNDIPKLIERSALVIDVLFDECSQFSSITKRNLETLKKSSSTIQS